MAALSPNPLSTARQGHADVQSAAIFANPIAGRGRGGAIAHLLQHTLQAAGIRCALPGGDGPPPAPLDPIPSPDAIIVIGGDGTLRAVAQRCLEERGQIPPLLVVPMGTANLMARHLGTAWRFPDLAGKVLLSLQRGRITRLDAGQANGQLFLALAGIGIDGLVVHELHRHRHSAIRSVSYLLPALLAMKKYRYTPLRVVVDGREVFPSAPAMAFLANIREHGLGFPLLPNARPDDGWLDVCVIPTTSLRETTRQFLRAAIGVHLRGRGVVCVRGRQIEIHSPQPVPMQVDGDPAGCTPARIGLLHTLVPFIVPV